MLQSITATALAWKPGHLSGKMGGSASSWMEGTTSLFHLDVCPVLVAGLSNGDLLIHHTARCLHGVSVSSKGIKAFSACHSPITLQLDLAATVQNWWLPVPWPRLSLPCCDPWSWLWSRCNKVILISAAESPHNYTWHCSSKTRAWTLPVHSYHCLHVCCVSELMLNRFSRHL